MPVLIAQKARQFCREHMSALKPVRNAIPKDKKDLISWQPSHHSFLCYCLTWEKDTRIKSIFRTIASTVNVSLRVREERMLLTGIHTVADISCTICATKIGWKYIEAAEDTQKVQGKQIYCGKGKDCQGVCLGGMISQTPPPTFGCASSWVTTWSSFYLPPLYHPILPKHPNSITHRFCFFRIPLYLSW